MNTQPLLAQYNFTDCLQLMVEERITRCVETIRAFHEERDYQPFEDIPALPPIGATEEEIQKLETIMKMQLPEEYKILLQRHRYIEYRPGVNIYGFDWQGIRICGSPFVLDNFFTVGQFLVVGDYWRFADGDQLLIALHEEDQPVYAYFHEHEPRIEYFAPTITAALWRITFEEI